MAAEVAFNNDDNVVYFEETIGQNNLTVALKRYKGRDLLHVRQYDDYGYPTRKGVCLTLENVRTLLQKVISEAVKTLETREEKTYKITEEIRLQTTKFGTADLRVYWKPDTDYVPTKIGTPIKYQEFMQLIDILERNREYYFTA
jgi:hypothetical protein